jgi:hypothetical protein
VNRSVLAAHQPDLLPYTGFWYKLLHADMFDLAIWDQINWKGYTARVRMRGDWVSLPVVQRASAMRICDVRLHTDAIDSLFRTVRGRYQGAPFWRERSDWLLNLIDTSRSEKLWQVNLSLILGIRDWLGITTPICLAPAPTEPKTSGIAELCTRYRTFDYLAGAGSREYLDEQYLRECAIKTHWSAHEAWTGDSILTTLFYKEDPMAWVRREEGVESVVHDDDFPGERPPTRPPDPGDGRQWCDGCRRWKFLVIHSCPGVEQRGPHPDMVITDDPLMDEVVAEQTVIEHGGEPLGGIGDELARARREAETGGVS